MTTQRVRRVVDAAFKIEAVHRMEVRRARKIPVTEIARDLRFRPDMLPTWVAHTLRME